jgi:hypothetical protein
MKKNFPVPVLAEPLQASDVEPGNTTHTRSGEQRESIKREGVISPSDSCGGENIQALRSSIQLLKEGVYEHVPPAIYLGLPEEAVSRSDLLMIDPPAKYRYFKDHPEELKETPAMQFGTAFHTLIMEPDVFHARHVVSQYNDYRTGEAREWRDEQIKNGATVLKSEQIDALVQMEANAREHPMFSQVFRRTETKIEVSALSKHPATGILRKSRMDCVPPGNSIWDIKTISKENGASATAAGRAIIDMNYGMQAAMSLDCWNAVTPRRKEKFTMFFCESEPPYLVAAYVIPEEVIEGCRKLINARLYVLAECRANKRWPSYKPVDYPDFPRWFIAQMEGAT